MARPRTAPSGAELDKLKKRVRKPGGGLYAKVMVYGPNGSGKTRFCATGEDTLVVEIEAETEGDRSIKQAPRTRVIDIRTWEHIGTLYWWLKSGNHPFKTVGLDTITAMQSLALAFVLDEAEERDPTRERSMPDKRTWGRSGQLMRAMILAYKDLPMHVIFAAQERIIRDEDTGEIIEITPDLPQSSRGAALGAAGVIGRLVPKEVRVRSSNGRVKKKWQDHLMVGPHEIIRTKDRTLVLPTVMRNPTMKEIIKVWQSNPPKEA